MTRPLKLMCIFAHPDDEALGMGGVLAKYAAEGVEITLVTATRGERGWAGPAEQNPGLQALGQVREAELHCAAEQLGLRAVHFLDYIDGELDQADPAEAIGRIVSLVRQAQPQVVVTFSPDGAYGHPDHIAISQLSGAALVCAADSSYQDPRHLPAHRVQKLYYMVDSQPLVQYIKERFGGIQFEVDGVLREHTGWADWAITTRIDATAYWQAAWQAIQCHQSQLRGMSFLYELKDEEHRFAWGMGNFYRVFSLVNGGRKPEDDLFSGLRG